MPISKRWQSMPCLLTVQSYYQPQYIAYVHLAFFLVELHPPFPTWHTAELSPSLIQVLSKLFVFDIADLNPILKHCWKTRWFVFFAELFLFSIHRWCLSCLFRWEALPRNNTLLRDTSLPYIAKLCSSLIQCRPIHCPITMLSYCQSQYNADVPHIFLQCRAIPSLFKVMRFSPSQKSAVAHPVLLHCWSPPNPNTRTSCYQPECLMRYILFFISLPIYSQS